MKGDIPFWKGFCAGVIIGMSIGVLILKLI